MACPTEDFIENITGKKLSQIKTLNLEGMKFHLITSEVFNKMPQLTVLNLSRNCLTTVPSDLLLPRLRELDVSDNQLTSLEFTGQFPYLEELYTDNNELEPSEKYIAATLCPRLKTLNNYQTETLRKMVTTFHTRLQPQVHGVWAASLADTYKDGIPEKEKVTVLEKFVKELERQNLTGPTLLTKYRDFMVNRLAVELLDSVSSGTFEYCSPRKKRRQDHMLGSPGTPRFTVIKRKGLIANLPPIPDYDPIHFIRCHFGGSKEHTDNNPTDDGTQVWRAEFEPNPHKPGEYTNVVATVGGHNVCLIDCETGKVLKRYKEIGQHFFTIAWTTVEMKQRERSWPTNILAAAGVNGHVKLLHPDQLVCYHEFEVAGRKRPDYINFAVFHPVRKTHLYCGDTNGLISAWDIGTPTGDDYNTKVTPLFSLASKTDAVVSLVVTSTDKLIAGCEGALLAWNVGPGLREKIRVADVELVLPGVKEADVDGLVAIGDDMIACKIAGEGCIYLWRVSTVLGSRKKQMKIDPMAILEWHETETMYLNLGSSREGFLACGDDRGQVWMYNVSRLLKVSSVQADELHRPSRILQWPHCDTQDKRDVESLMIDLLESREEMPVNHVAISGNGEFLVASMANNMVCIWRRQQ